MFSEPHEQELLWLKFNVEDPYIDKWIMTESSYTFQGRRKPIYINDILSQARFDRFRSKIHIITIDRNYNFEYEISFIDLFKRKVKRWLNAHRGRNYELVPYAENASFYAEINQRQACVEYIKQHYTPIDIVIACDADEIFDFNEGKIDIFKDILAEHATPFYIRREIFCYDYDNTANRLRYSPIVRLGDLLGSESSMHAIRHPQPSKRVIAQAERLLAYEYTFCFSKEAIVKKLATFAHVTDLDEAALDFCFDNNIALIAPNRIDQHYLKSSESFFTTLKINNENAPKYLRDNYDHFRTGIISPDYENNRKQNNIEQQ